jgi:predicted nucleic acid-binding protein
VTIVVDASVAVKWVVNEEHSAEANALRAEDDLVAPSLIAVEIASALLKAVRRGAIQRRDALPALRASLLAFANLVTDNALHLRALTLALDLGHPVPDCLYLALAEQQNAPLATADETMIAAARRAKIKVRRV